MSGRLLGQELYARVAKALADYYDRLDQLKVICSDKKTYLNEAVRESVKLCVFLERSHPFTDGNCRVLIMQLLPKLLCDLGFGDIYIFEDPNRFDLYSLDQCVEEVIKALEHAQDITNCRSSLLTKVCGSNFLKDLASQKQSDYFNQCTREYIEITELAEFSTSYYRIDKDTEQRVLDLFTAYNRTECSWFAYLKNELPKYKLSVTQLYQHMKINTLIYGSEHALIHDAMLYLGFQSKTSKADLVLLQEILALPGFDINKKNLDGNTAIHLAITSGNTDLVCFLIATAKPSMTIELTVRVNFPG